MSTDNIEKDFSNFTPKPYLDEYYTRIDYENRKLLEFFAEAYRNLPADAHMLEFGGGPTIYQLITAAANVKEIVFSDYSGANLREVKKWCNEENGAFQWDSFIEESLKLEHKDSGPVAMEKRKALLRSKITQFIQGDAFKENPLGKEFSESFDVVGVNFVPEGITDSKEQWKVLVQNISSLVKRHGALIMVSITGAKYWKSGNTSYVSASITQDDLKNLLVELGYELALSKSIVAENPELSGYTGISMIKAIKQF